MIIADLLTLGVALHYAISVISTYMYNLSKSIVLIVLQFLSYLLFNYLKKDNVNFVDI